MRTFVIVVVIASGLAAGWMPHHARNENVTRQSRQEFQFDSASVTFSNTFSGARINEVDQLAPTEFQLTICPENTPVNNSAWYAFQVTSGQSQTISVRLVYQNGTHRYAPKISRDGVIWKPLSADLIQKGSDKDAVIMRLNVGPQPLWVAGQELIGVPQLNQWLRGLPRLPFAELGVAGHSVEGRPIPKLELSKSGAGPGLVVIIGRQHPPEVTGSLGLMAFVETVTGESELVREFRDRFHVLVVPLVNPDGVEHGHWRHNMNGVDLNRDWGSFAQPETRAIRDEIDGLVGGSELRLCMFLDFHSTQRDVFYTQDDEQEEFPPGFTRRWLTALGDRVPGYSIRRVVSSGSKPTAQRWAYRAFGAPSVTYEFGDNSNRAKIQQVTTCAAEEMMRLLLVAHKELLAEPATLAR